MSGGRGAEASILFLLRIGVGSLWVYDGLVVRLLAVGFHLAPALAWPGLDLSPTVQSRLAGAVEVALGLLLLSGVLVRTAAAIQCLVLALLTLEAAHAMPHAFLRPMGFLSWNIVLATASLALALVPVRGGDAARQERLLAPILRFGLGTLWLYEGLVVKWLAAVPVEVELFARTDLVPSGQLEAFVRMLGLLEAALGLTVLAGFRVRQLAVLQVGLLAALGILIGWVSPQELLAAPGGVSRHLAVVGCALILYQVGGGALALDGWLATNRTWRRWRLLLTLQGAWLLKVGMIEVCQVQGRAADRHVEGVLQKIERDELHHGLDLLSLLQRHGGRPLPVAGLVKGLGRVFGCLTVIVGMRLALQADLWAKERALSLYARAARLLPAEEALTARALQAMQGREAAHQQLLRESLRPRQRR